MNAKTDQRVAVPLRIMGATAIQITRMAIRICSNKTAILKSAKIADLPVAQNSTYEFVINLTTAKVLRITIPPSIFAQATEVIQ